MNPQIIVRAWKDKAFRAQLSDAQRSALPHNPAGQSSLMVQDMKESPCITSPVCTLYGPRCI